MEVRAVLARGPRVNTDACARTYLPVGPSSAGVVFLNSLATLARAPRPVRRATCMRWRERLSTVAATRAGFLVKFVLTTPHPMAQVDVAGNRSNTKWTVCCVR
jgi:hypothetical protein